MKAVGSQQSAARGQNQKLKVKIARCTLDATRHSLFTFCFFLFTLGSLFAACGKKAPPTLKAYEKPETPSDLKAIHREDRVILSWVHNKKENLKELHIMKSEDAVFKKITSVATDENSYSDTDFKTDNSYKYKIIAMSMKNVLSNDSNIANVNPKPVPFAPKGFAAHVGNNAIHLSWESAGEGILYNVYKYFEKTKHGINPVNPEPLKTTAYTDNLELNMPVYYTVRGALNSDVRDEGPASDEIEVNPADFIPSKPEGIQAVVADDKVVIAWKENPEKWVKRYRVYRKITKNDEFTLIGEPVTPAFTDREKTGTKHTFKITAFGPSKESEFSNMVTVDF